AWEISRGRGASGSSRQCVRPVRRTGAAERRASTSSRVEATCRTTVLRPRGRFIPAPPSGPWSPPHLELAPHDLARVPLPHPPLVRERGDQQEAAAVLRIR